MKKLEMAAALGLILAIAMGDVSDVAAHLHKLEQGVLRLHILADSDSDEDQARKLLVRDALLEQSEELFAGCETLEEMKARAVEEQETIRLLAKTTLEANGCNDDVRVQLVQMTFDEREYEEITMPAGCYDAVRILIGEAKGHNWWCVMYPPLCLPAACEPEECFDAETTDLLREPEQYEVKLKCVELWDSFVSCLHGE